MLSGARYFIAPKGEGLNASDPLLSGLSLEKIGQP